MLLSLLFVFILLMTLIILMDEIDDLQELVNDCTDGEMGVNAPGVRPSRIVIYGGTDELRRGFSAVFRGRLRYEAVVEESAERPGFGVYGIDVGALARLQIDAKMREKERMALIAHSHPIPKVS